MRRTDRRPGRTPGTRPRLSRAALALFLAATPALACGGLIGPNGAVNLLRTTTFAGYHDGVEHYVTAFQFAGGGGAVRLDHAAARHPDERREGRRLDAPAARSARRTRSSCEAFARRRRAPTRPGRRRAAEGQDRRARHHGPEGRRGRHRRSGPRPTASASRPTRRRSSTSTRSAARSSSPRRSTPMRRRRAASRSATARRSTSRSRPTNPWVPLRILALGKTGGEPVQADVYLLTDHAPALLPAPTGSNGIRLDASEPASRRPARRTSAPTAGWTGSRRPAG